MYNGNFNNFPGGALRANGALNAGPGPAPTLLTFKVRIPYLNLAYDNKNKVRNSGFGSRNRTIIRPHLSFTQKRCEHKGTAKATR